MNERTSTIETPTRRTILRSSAVIATAGAIGTAQVSAQDCDEEVEEGESIQDAIDDASSGETICVDSGTYVEDVEVDVEDVTLSGPNAGTPGYGDRGDEATIEGQVVLVADGTTLDGFDVSPPDATADAEAEAVRVSNTPDDVVVENNVVREFEEGGLPAWEGIDGINVFGGDEDEPIENATVRYNEVRELSGLPEQGGAEGISVQGNVDGATVEQNVVTDVGMERTGWAFGVVVRGTGNHGVSPRNVDVYCNKTAWILSNPTTDTVGLGLGVEEAEENVVMTRNTTRDNEYGSEIKAGAAAVTTLTENNIVDNELGVENLDDAELDATCNWWGHEDGPEHESANGVEGDVDYEPWSIREIDHEWDADEHCTGGEDGDGNAESSDDGSGDCRWKRDDDPKDDDPKDDDEPKGDDDHDKRDEKDDDGKDDDGKDDEPKGDDDHDKRDEKGEEGKGHETGRGGGEGHPGRGGDGDRSRGRRDGGSRPGFQR